ncbi:hypothetical protein E4U55_008160 [Claviceps digitariae]|nr:hypothetical protein E4U55_008160 [Claviceps digitariae]
MRFTPIVIAFTAWQSLASAVAIEKTLLARDWDPVYDVDPKKCTDPDQHWALMGTLNYLQANVKASKRVALPVLPQENIDNPDLPLSNDLHARLVEPIIRLSKEQPVDFEDIFAAYAAEHTPANNNVIARLDKRIRQCPEIKKAATASASSFSCDSAPDPAGCRECANFLTFNLACACVACAAKMNHESIFCCMAASATFASGYTQVCLRR